MEELLSLKWNNHRSTFLHILTILRDKQLYTDATLACEGRFYSVHRLVLSTCSDYFSAMFDRTTCKNPIIVLKDIKCEDLEALLDYMYLGEVNVRQADLASLIKAAECLRVKGLAVPDDEPPTRRGGRGAAATRGANGSGGGSPSAKRKRRDDAATQDGREDVRPAPAVRSNRSPSQSSSRLSPPVGGSDGGDTKVGSPSGGLTQRPASSDHLSRGNGGPADSGLEDHPTPFVKVEQEDPSGDDMGGGDVDPFDVQNDTYKEEEEDNDTAGDPGGGELSNDLPEFLQQATGSHLGGTSFGHGSFPGTSSFQSGDLGWQGEGSNLNFPGHLNYSSSETSSQNAPPGEGPCCTAEGTLRRGGGDAVVTCPQCAKSFTGPNRQYVLHRHLTTTHTPFKPYRCPSCPYRAARRDHVTRHMKVMHPLGDLKLGRPPSANADLEADDVLHLSWQVKSLLNSRHQVDRAERTDLN